MIGFAQYPAWGHHRVNANSLGTPHTLAISNYKQHLASYLVQNTWNACLCQIAISGNWWPVTNHLAVFFLQFCDAAKVGNHPQSWFSQILAVNKNMKEKSLNILIYIFGYIIGPCIERNLAKFNSYHWLIPNFISLFLSFFLSFSLSLSELLLHWCMITCRVAAPAAAATSPGSSIIHHWHTSIYAI